MAHFGTPIYLGEADVQFAKNGFSAKALGAYVAYPDADKIKCCVCKKYRQRHVWRLRRVSV